MLILTVGFERKCDFVEFLVNRSISGISGMSERCTGDKSIVEIYAEEDIKELLSELLADYILGPYRRRLAVSCIASECPFAGSEEKVAILNALPFKEYEPVIKAKILDYIKTNDFLDIPGFVRFRMPDFAKKVMADTSCVCEKFIKKREYEDMVSLLRHHITLSGSSGTAQLIFRKDGFSIVYPDGSSTDSSESPAGSLDVILGMLMINIPEKIAVFNSHFAEDGLLSTIEQVFGREAIEYCN